jgi:polar amino acid transport system permease protein
MSASTTLVSEELQPSPPPSAPQPVTPLAAGGLALAVLGTVAMLVAVSRLRDYNHGGAVSTVIAGVLVVGSLVAWVPAIRAFPAARQRASLLRDDRLVAARRIAAKGREDALVSMGFAASVLIIAAILLFVLANNGGVAHTFFALDPIRQSFKQVLQGFWTNVWVAVVAEILVLIFGLLVAIVRMLPGRAGAPLRFLAVVYADVFRGVPAIIVILLVGFGLPLTGVKLFQDFPLQFLGIIALTLTYTAYVSEVYRAGLASIHPSQSAAARSLGLSYGQTLRTVLVPQAVRRVVPPLLNDFIGLQKDTALLFSIGVAETLENSKLWEADLFNLSPILLSALFFVIITIPQARFVDYLIERDARARGGRT